MDKKIVVKKQTKNPHIYCQFYTPLAGFEAAVLFVNELYLVNKNFSVIFFFCSKGIFLIPFKVDCIFKIKLLFF